MDRKESKGTKRRGIYRKESKGWRGGEWIERRARERKEGNV